MCPYLIRIHVPPVQGPPPVSPLRAAAAPRTLHRALSRLLPRTAKEKVSVKLCNNHAGFKNDWSVRT